MRGGEKVLDNLCRLFPRAELFTLIYNKGSLNPLLEARSIHTSFLRVFPCVKKRYRNYLPIFPLAIESFNLKGFDLVISSSHCVAKGVKKPEGAVHFCYCHTPMRYMWRFFDQYFGSYPGWKKSLIKFFGDYLKNWDIATLPRVDEFIANSYTIKERIRDIYKRESSVIYPPVEIDRFSFNEDHRKGGYYFCVSALVPYKRIDIIVDAFNRMPDKKLVIAGDGNSRKELEARKRHSNISFTGWVSDDEIVRLYEGAKAFVFAAEEDFGIAPVEAQAAGLPVIAYGKGGATETVVPVNGPRGEGKPTGLFFFEQTTQSLIDAVSEFEKRENEFNPLDIRRNAERFNGDRFRNDMKNFINDKMGRTVL